MNPDLRSLGVVPLDSVVHRNHVPIPNADQLPFDWPMPCDGPTVVPRIDSLFELESRCAADGPEKEFWEWAAVAAAKDLGVYVQWGEWLVAINYLKGRRNGTLLEFSLADRAICEEVNLFLSRIMKDGDMSTATSGRLTKPKSKKPATDDLVDDRKMTDDERDSALKRLTTSTAGDAVRWSQLSAGPVSDTEILDRIRPMWRKGRAVNEGNLVAFAESGSDFTRVWFDQDHSNGTPSLSGEDLVDQVRRVWKLPEPTSAVPTSERHTSIDTVEETSGPTKADVLQSRVLISLALIDDSPFQTRDEPSPAKVDELAHSIETVGQLKPLRVRAGSPGRYELIGGHTRVRALRQLKWADALCDVVSADDATASLEVFEDNRQEPLNAIERAKAIKVNWATYQAAGRKQEDLAKDLGLAKSTVSNMIRLLEAPASLQKRLISGEISQPQVRQLVAWTDRPGIVTRFLSELDSRCSSGPVNNYHWEAALEAAIKANSKSVTRSQYDGDGGPIFDCSKHLDELEVVEFNVGRGKQRRAFNVKRWNELQNEAKKKRDERDKKKRAAEATGTAKPSKAKTDRESWAFKSRLQGAWNEPAWSAVGQLLKGKPSKAQKIAAVRLREIVRFEELPIAEILTMTQDEWIEAAMKGMLANWDDECPYMSIEEMGSIATFFAIDVAGTWKPTEDLLQVTAKADLVELAEEIGELAVDGEPARKVLQAKGTDAEMIKVLLECWPAGWVPSIYDPNPKPTKKGKAK